MRWRTIKTRSPKQKEKNGGEKEEGTREEEEPEKLKENKLCSSVLLVPDDFAHHLICLFVLAPLRHIFSLDITSNLPL